MSARRVVAVTGATGFLGRHIVAALAHAGATPRILLRNGADDFGPEAETVRGRLEDTQALAALTAGADAVVHAAALIKATSRAAFLRTNRGGTAAIAEAARRNAPEARFILVSSLAARAPWLSPYAASKHAAEQVALAIYAKHPEQLVILRPSAIYGPGDLETLIVFKLALRGLAPAIGRPCSQPRYSCIHATDAAAAIARIALGAGTAGTYSLSDANPAGYPLDEIMSQAARAVGAAPPRTLKIPSQILLSLGAAAGAWAALRRRPTMFTAGKARELLHTDWSVHPAETLPAAIYTPKITLPAGLTETAAWYRANGWLK